MDFIGIAKEIAPVASVIGSVLTVLFIPMLGKLHKIDKKLEGLAVWCAAHDKLDDTRFRHLEQRLNALYENKEGRINEFPTESQAGVR